MTKPKISDLIGYSELSIKEAIHDALNKTPPAHRVEVVETRGSQTNDHPCEYHVTLAIFEN